MIALVGRCAVNHSVMHREIPGTCIAQVSRESGETRFKHENTDACTVYALGSGGRRWQHVEQPWQAMDGSVDLSAEYSVQARLVVEQGLCLRWRVDVNVDISKIIIG